MMDSQSFIVSCQMSHCELVRALYVLVMVFRELFLDHIDDNLVQIPILDAFFAF